MMGYPGARADQNQRQARVLAASNLPNDPWDFLETDPAQRSAFCISDRALFLTRLDVVACGDTSGGRGEAPKLTEIFAIL